MLHSFGQIRATVLRLGMRTSSLLNTWHVATRRKRVAKRAQHVAPNNVAICCAEMLHRLDVACKHCANNVAIYCDDMLRLFYYEYDYRPNCNFLLKATKSTFKRFEAFLSRSVFFDLVETSLAIIENGVSSCVQWDRRLLAKQPITSKNRRFAERLCIL